MSLIETIYHYRHLCIKDKAAAAVFLQATCSTEVRAAISSSVNEQGMFIKADGKLFTNFRDSGSIKSNPKSK